MFKQKSTTKDQKTVKVEPVKLNDELPAANIQEIESAVDNSFFYTNDKFFDQMDSTTIINEILMSYPEFIATNTDTQIKHEFLDMLQNTEYVNSLLEQYNMTINDFMKIMCKAYGSIFKGMFLKKIKTLLEYYE